MCKHCPQHDAPNSKAKPPDPSRCALRALPCGEGVRVRGNRCDTFCIRNDDHEVSLEIRKIYQIIPDAAATNNHMRRVIDESGEDSLYPADFFMLIELPKAARKTLVRAV